jgi:hypothetical protein
MREDQGVSCTVYAKLFNLSNLLCLYQISRGVSGTLHDTSEGCCLLLWAIGRFLCAP